MSKSFRIFIIGLAALLLLPVSCNRRPLEDASELVRIMVEINVEFISNVTMDIYNENIPVPELNTDMMRVLVYDPDTKNLITQSFISSKSYDENGNQVFSGSLNISYGTFDFLVYNFDTPTTQVSSENNEDEIIAYTNPIPESLRDRFLATKIGEEASQPISINYEPDHLVVASEKNMRISPHDDIVVVETTARPINDTYYLQIHVEGMQFASSATAVISGLSPSTRFGAGVRTAEPSVAVAFELNKSTDYRLAGENKDVLCAVFNTFGKVPESPSELIVTFNVVDTAGNLQQYETSLDEVFKTEDAIERHWLLIDETWVIQDPKPNNPGTASGGGFQPKVDDWDQQSGEINF